jgi:hypothetical protein
MSLLSVSMPASAPFCTALVKFCSIVAHFPTASCSAWGEVAGLVPSPEVSMLRAVSAEPAGVRKPSCCASATPRYPHAPQGCENARFAGPSRIPNGTVPLSG